MNRLFVSLLICLVAGGSLASAQTFPFEMFDTDMPLPHVYKERRARVLSSMTNASIAIVFSADVRNRQNDVDYEYRQSSDMLYLTGCQTPGTTLLLAPAGIQIGSRTFNEVLFVPQRNVDREVWQGVSMGPQEAMQYLGVDTALVATDLKSVLDSLLPRVDTLHYSTLPTKALLVPLAGKNLYADAELKKWAKERKASLVFKTPMAILRAMREVKDTAELRLLRKAIEISMEGHRATMRGARPGMKEYELEALMEYGFKRQGAEDVGYPSIVGSNYNACILHYTANRRATTMNDLVLADCGAEYHGYTADITRTFPLSGKFTNEQRQIYDLVLAAQDAGIAASVAGAPFRAPHAAATTVIADGLLKLGIIKDLADVKQYFMHGTSHYLGLDVHDPGTGGPLQVNSVITVEPGIYIPAGSACDKRWWNIGVRIEDDILITAEGPVNLSATLARTAADIEALCGTAPQH
jgi:Xaa-Pro aminopeptidase